MKICIPGLIKTHENRVVLVAAGRSVIADAIVHSGVANMPRGVPLAATLALSNVTLPLGAGIGALGLPSGARGFPGFAQGAQRHGWEDYPRESRRGVRTGVSRLGIDD